MRRRVSFDRDKVQKAMMKKSCRETYQSVADNTSISYENLRSCLSHGLIMPDHLEEIANYLNVRKEELQ